jgi:hypothetical protein
MLRISGHALAATTAVLIACPQPAGAQASQPPDAHKYQIEARLMFWAAVAENDSLPNQDGTVQDFFVRRARLVFQGRPTESISFSVQVGQDNIGGKLLTDDGSIRIKDAYINYRATPAFQVTAGQFKIPFLRSNLESAFNQLLIDRGGLVGQRPAREGSRDLGVMAWGNVDALQYRVALYDGADQERQNSESSFRLSSRLAYNWFTRESGMSYTGTALGASRVLQIGGQIDLQDARLDSRDEGSFQNEQRDYRAYAVDAFFEQPFARASAVTLEAAWLGRRDDYVRRELATRTLDGYYLQGAYLLPGQLGPGRLQFVVRREGWQVGRGAFDADTSRDTIGATYYLHGHNRKLQADFTRKRERPEVNNNEFRLSTAIVF